MKISLYGLLIISFILSSGCTSSPDVEEDTFNVVGNWTVTYTSPGNNQNVRSTYTFSGSETAGTVKSDNGASGKYTVSGRSVSFTLMKTTSDAGKVTNTYTGTAASDTRMSGSFKQTFETYPRTTYTVNWQAEKK